MLDYKTQTRRQWNQTPCGTGNFLGTVISESTEWFDEIRRNRYEVTDSWMPKVIDFEMARGKKLLEIGHGIGSDLLTFCEHGAEVYGVDITPEHHRLATRNFQLHGRSAELKLCDAADLEYPDEFFDIVYSHGVLHHTPDTERCIDEAYRVLKPGGTFVLSMYHKYSAFHICSKLIYDGCLHGKLLTLGYPGLMATLERGADGRTTRPLVKTYCRNGIRRMLSRFSRSRIEVAHFDRQHVPRLGFLIPQRWTHWLDRRLGWYVLGFATK